MQTKKELYLKAKKAYYDGSPIISDAEFDELERALKENGEIEVTETVGAWDRKAKFEHPTPMKSLEKIQADKTTGAPPTEEFIKWLKSRMEIIGDDFIVEFSEKLDGNAINLVYEDKKLVHALSRGNGKLGRDYISKLDLTKIPTTISYNNESGERTFEIRCEAVISKETFEKKYSKDFSNERNYVAGILNTDDATAEQYSEIDLIPVEMRSLKNGELHYHHSSVPTYMVGFNNELNHNSLLASDLLKNPSLFEELFNSYYDFKQDVSPYRIDGMVVKIGSRNRAIVGEHDHHPKWAIAVKFKPEDCVTKIVGFEMKMGKTGVFTPVALLEPVDLDGSIVSKASAYNYDYVNKNSLNVGSIVTLVKSGDIIPQIVNIVSSSEEPYDLLGTCPYCGEKLSVLNNKFVHCPNEQCRGKQLQKFINSFSVLDLYGVGESFITTLFDYVSDDIFYYLTNDKQTLDFEIRESLTEGKTLDNFMSELFKVKSLTIEQVIGLFSFDGISNNGKTIKEIAKKLSGVPYSFHGLEKKVVDGWDEDGEKFKAVSKKIGELEYNGIEIIPLESIKEGIKVLKLCLTGSPKSFGFKTKKDYIKSLNDKGIEVEETTVGECDILVTDDINSSSSKMKTAQKQNKKIITYEQEVLL